MSPKKYSILYCSTLMPRISPTALRTATKTLSLLARLLRGLRDLPQATRELQWIKNELPPSQWKSAVVRRSRNEPLQYILGSQPFGVLNIKCRPGALIPRWETEEWVLEVAEILKQHYEGSTLTVVDACTGTGCIPLLLEQELGGNTQVQTFGFDASSDALKVALENVTLVGRQFENCTTTILQGDLLDKMLLHSINITDANLITANPPYIPENDYKLPVLLNGVEKSARMYEPRMALVGDTDFYSALINNLVRPLGACGFVFELGYDHQADHVNEYLQEKSKRIWGVGRRYDSAGNIRCVIGWKVGSNLECLSKLCQSIYDK